MAEKPRATVGYAMPQRKLDTVFQPSLITQAKEQGIDLVQVHLDKPLVEQGPFDCLVHKVYGQEWNAQLQAFKSKYPFVIIIDSPDYIECIHNRSSMLEVVNNLRVSDQIPSCDNDILSLGVPKQVVINSDGDLSNMHEKLKFPVLAKSLLANASVNSHEMSLIFNTNGLLKVKPPVVLQEFVNHGGVLFKVYVAGNHVKCVKRKSLPNFHISDAETQGDSLSFAEISSSASSDDDQFIKDAEMPSMDFVKSVAKGLKEGSKLNLFNFDMIRDANEGNKYFIIDINYFPGFAKVPGFEIMLTDFFWDVINLKNIDDDEGALQKEENCVNHSA